MAKYIHVLSSLLFRKRKPGKTMILIDGPNVYHSQKSIGGDIDLEKLKTFFNANGGTVEVIYFDSGFNLPSYTEVKNMGESEVKQVLKILTARIIRQKKFERIGFKVIIPPDGKNQNQNKENSDTDVDVGIGEWIISTAIGLDYQRIVLVSGDARHFSKFLKLAKHISANNKRRLTIEVVKSKIHLSKSFESVADKVHNFEDLPGIIIKEEQETSGT